MLTDYFKLCDLECGHINCFANIDSPNSPFDCFINFFDLSRFDISINHARSESRYLNFILLNKILKSHNISNCLILCSDFDGSLDLDFFKNHSLKNNFLLILTRKKRKIISADPYICVQNVPFDTSLQEFILKLFTHLQKIIKLESFQDQNASFPSQIYSFQKLRDVANVDDDLFIGHTTIKSNKLDFIFSRDRKSQNLLIINQAAVSRTRELPIFQRWKWINDFNANVLILNDPLLYKSPTLKAGWWVGTAACDLTYEFSKELGELLKKLEIPSKNTFFYGSSAGGFSSLQQSSCLKGSTAIVDIAQTDLFTYKQKNEVELTTTACYGTHDLNEIENKFSYRFRVIDRLKQLDNIPNIYILQNLEDTHHLLSQTLPLVKYLNTRDKSKYTIYCYSLVHPIKGGHYPLPRHRTVQFINKVMNYPWMCLTASELEDYGLKNFDRYVK